MGNYLVEMEVFRGLSGNLTRNLENKNLKQLRMNFFSIKNSNSQSRYKDADLDPATFYPSNNILNAGASFTSSLFFLVADSLQHYSITASSKTFQVCRLLW